MRKQARYMRDQLPVTTNAARSARFSAKAAYRGVKHAERTTAVTERALVLIEDVGRQPITSPFDNYFNGSSVVVFILKNFGDTAAHSVKLKGDITFPGGSMNVVDWPESTIPPQGIRKFITFSLGTRLNDAAIDEINLNGNLRYSIEVTYTDVFNKTKTHTYKAEGQYIPLLRDFVVVSSTSD